jgi:phenylalanyl-tRNA synthetase beta chain
MKFTLSWLHDHLDTKASLDALETKLSAIGLEVEGIEDAGAKLAAFTLARIVEAKQHPNADRLKVCQVEIAPGQPLLEVVCGAPNARVGLITVFAPLGTYIPGSQITLEKKPVRGVVSNGMLCSAAELELASEADGILDLGDAFAPKVGQRYVDVMGLSDPVIEVKLTPNRPDCTGVRGIARDLAAAGMGKLRPEPALGKVEGDKPCPVQIKLDFTPDTESACPAFAGRVISGVKNGPSPAWLQSRLKAIGLRPINALVDVTNYISIDRGRPLHVYDVTKLKGPIRARLGQAGETFLGLDGKSYTVDDAACVIADDAQVLGFGGIMGGEASGSTDATTSVFIESAYFDPLRTAATGRKAGIVSDARYRFERGIDPASVMPGLDLATDMILKLCGGTPSKALMAGTPPTTLRTIAFDFGRVQKLSGIAIKDTEIRIILEALGCTVDGQIAPGKATQGKVAVTIPTWRPDIHGPADLVEEVVRIAGLDRIPSTPLPGLDSVTKPVLTERQKRARRARRTLATRGFVEAVTYSFIPPDDAKRFGGGAPALDLANPMSVDLSAMRPSLLPGLLAALARNRNRGLADVALFELGQAYRGDQPDDQYVSATGVRSGTAEITGAGRHWDGSASDVTAFDVKADAAAVLASLGFDITKAQITRDVPAHYHPGRSGAIKLGPKVVLATFGELHPEVAKVMDLSGPVAIFEVFIEALPAEKKKSRTKNPLPLSELLPLTRDFAFILDAKVSASDVIKAASAADKTLITNVTVFDLFEGGALAAEGKKSLGVAVTLQPGSVTLTDKDIELVSTKIIDGVKQATGGEIRG